MQMSVFDIGCEKFKITKPIRLIELFAGYGSQHLALKYLGTNFECYKICEWAVKSIQAYKDLHFPNDNKDYSFGRSYQEVIDFLYRKHISLDYNKPMTREQITRMGEKKARTVYNNIFATHNLVDIQSVSGDDLEIIDNDKFDYIMTYSFPCQDLSNAGLGKGMEKGSGTRSSLLWEVERILEECKQMGSLPKVLIMENVPDVIGLSNIKQFAQWLSKLEELGYHCDWKILNSKDFGVPQNRERCFMVSILGKFYYDFPQGVPLNKKLKDMLETNVDEKFYLSDRAIQGSLTTNFNTSKFENKIPKNDIVPTILARDFKDPKCVIINNENCPINACNMNFLYNDYRIRKLTPRECFRLMGVRDQDFDKVSKNQSNASLYHLAGDSIVVNVLMAIFKNIL